MSKKITSQTTGWLKSNNHIWHRKVMIKTVTTGWNFINTGNKPSVTMTEGQMMYDSILDTWIIVYHEGDDILDHKSTTKLVIYPDQTINLHRNGVVGMDMLFSQGNELVLHRRNEKGIERLSLFVHDTKADINEKGGHIKIQYSARINSEFRLGMCFEFFIYDINNSWHESLMN